MENVRVILLMMNSHFCAHHSIRRFLKKTNQNSDERRSMKTLTRCPHLFSPEYVTATHLLLTSNMTSPFCRCSLERGGKIDETSKNTLSRAIHVGLHVAYTHVILVSSRPQPVPRLPCLNTSTPCFSACV